MRPPVPLPGFHNAGDWMYEAESALLGDCRRSGWGIALSMLARTSGQALADAMDDDGLVPWHPVARKNNSSRPTNGKGMRVESPRPGHQAY
jgi:hypothetical protein